MNFFFANLIVTSGSNEKVFSWSKILFKTEVLKNVLLQEKTFSFEPEVTIKLSKKKFKFYEVPITYNGRSYEEGKKIGLKDAFIALKTIILYSFKK